MNLPIPLPAELEPVEGRPFRLVVWVVGVVVVLFVLLILLEWLVLLGLGLSVLVGVGVVGEPD